MIGRFTFLFYHHVFIMFNYKNTLKIKTFFVYLCKVATPIGNANFKPIGGGKKLLQPALKVPHFHFFRQSSTATTQI